MANGLRLMSWRISLKHDNATRLHFGAAGLAGLKTVALATALAAGLALPGAAKADDEVVMKLTIKGHKFFPDRLDVPAKTKIILVIRNEDSEPEEFESADLRREKIVFPGIETRLVLGRLNPGEYKFVGEYHEDTAQGLIIAR